MWVFWGFSSWLRSCPVSSPRLLPPFLNIVVLPSIWWVLGIFFSYLWKQQADKLLFGMTQHVWIYVMSRRLFIVNLLNSFGKQTWRSPLSNQHSWEARQWPNRTQCEMCIQSSETTVVAEPLKVYWSLFGNTQHNLPWDPRLPIDLRYIRCVAVMV